MIELKGVCKRYGATEVIENLDLKVGDAESLCLLGRSGCGKSTALKIMGLISRADKGQVLVGGIETSRLGGEEIDKLREAIISYSYQEPLLLPYLNVLENVTHVVGASDEKALAILNRLGLSNRLDRRPSSLSGGEKKRVDIARALQRNTVVLVADEPFSNLDSDNASKVLELFNDYKNEGGTIIYSAVEPTMAKYSDLVLNMGG